MLDTTAAELRRKANDGEPPEGGLCLCLSGGGYRAMLFHAGALIRLNELGLLQRIRAVSSVSGGSITAGVLGMNWNKLKFNKKGVAANFDDHVIQPLRRIAGHPMEIPAGLWWLIPRLLGLLPTPPAPARIVEWYLRAVLFGKTTLQDLPAGGPRFVFNATNLASGVRWAFEREAMYDYRVGASLNPTTPLATAVAASAGFPPILAPLRYRPGKVAWEKNDAEGMDELGMPAYRRVIVLADGGIYGNLGFEEARYYNEAIILDAGSVIKPKRPIWAFIIPLLLRVSSVVYGQVRNNQSRQFIDLLRTEPGDKRFARWGRYINMETPVRAEKEGKVSGGLPCPVDATERLAALRTSLSRYGRRKQDRVMNWGYARCDYSMRMIHDRNFPPPSDFPFPGGVAP